MVMATATIVHGPAPAGQRRNGISPTQAGQVKTVDQAEIVRALKLILERGQVTELRALDAVTRNDRRPHTESGYFDDPDKLAEEVTTITSAKGIYFTPNAVNPALLARASNRIRPAGKEPTTSDRDIVRRKWLLLDFDATRPAGISASGDEHRAAIELAGHVRTTLSAEGWPEPIAADSGNGAHLMYRIDLPADDGGLIKRVLEALAERFSTEQVAVDTTVHNPARIWKLPGTRAAKGDSTADRPHRTARILAAPDKLVIVETALLESLAAQLPAAATAKQQRSGTPRGPQFDIDGWIQKYGLDVSGPEPWQGGRKWVFPNCPWNRDHADRSAYIVQQSSGPIAAGCHHAGCQGKGWHDLRDIVEPGWRNRGHLLSAERRHESNGSSSAAPAEAADPTNSDERTTDLNGAENRTEIGNAKRLAAKHGDSILYCRPLGGWLEYDGTHWATDAERSIEAKAKDITADLWAEASAGVAVRDRESTDLLKFAKASSSAKSVSACISLARSEPGITVKPAVFDTHPMLLNVQNGTIDLTTGELHSHRRADYLTKTCPVAYDPTARCPNLIRLLTSILEPDVIEFLQRGVGYSMTGMTSEQVLFVLYGTGANGKSTVLNAIQDVLGSDYSMKAATGLLMAKRHESHPTELADLFGKRFATSVEVENGRRLAESTVKELTGSDPVRARYMGKDFFEFTPSHKLWFAVNHKPVIGGTDNGIWRRIRLIPFTVTIAPDQQDKDLPQLLTAERAGILTWAVKGCLKWQQDGLGEPEAVRAATADYRSEMDILGAFLDECCLEQSGAKVRANHAYQVYKRWCADAGERVLTQRAFGRAMTERGIERFTANGTWYRGIKVLDQFTEGTEP